MDRRFGVEIEACARCGGKLRIIASIEEPEVIAKILAHLEKTAPDRVPAGVANRRAGAAGSRGGWFELEGRGIFRRQSRRRAEPGCARLGFEGRKRLGRWQFQGRAASGRAGNTV
ncbi:MAG: hypothetical protein QM757_34770 [Paludibaculum sp.]